MSLNMAEKKIAISWKELKSSKVEKQIHQQQAMARNRRYAQLTDKDIPQTVEKRSIWYNSIFCLAFFGFFGGLFGWGAEFLLHLRPDFKLQANQTLEFIEQLHKNVGPDGITQQAADSAIDVILRSTAGNPYLAIDLDKTLSDSQKAEKLQQLDHTNELNNLVANLLGFGICGMLISISLSIAEPIVDHNWPAAIRNGTIGAILGLLGGIAAAALIDRVYQTVGGVHPSQVQQYLARCASWAVLGCFIAAAPGIAAHSFKRLIIGIFGGALGGAIGGFLLEPVAHLAGNDEIGRLAGTIYIGMFTGIATGTIERAARTGWLKVTSGLIAGKQFILYRNPTFIGSAPDCQIYLFRDPHVGRRHAALHLINGGVELEDLPLGSPTLINGKPASRKRLVDGDKIQVGGTGFKYQEKNKSAK